jgi:4-hydroxy 2-oxovalerate aldolase
MSNLYLLDCTLRDGGYVNDWKFGEGSIKSIFSRLDASGVDAIEIGFLDSRQPYDPDRSIYPDTKSVEPVFKNMKKPHALITAMIDFGTCSIDNISPASESHIDAIRVIFKKHKQDEALAFISQIKEKGYKIIINPVSVTSYSDEEMISIIKKINKIEPYAVTIVDTYGLMHASEVLHYCSVLNEYLKKNIILAYHAHNNFQLAYANTIAVMDNVKNRDISIDGTLFGMGKSAGNACTELIAMYMNEVHGKHYDINQLQEAIDVDIQKEFDKCSWGYRPLFYIAALHDCHPNYVKYLLDKRSLSIKSVNEILGQIPESVKLLYDEKVIQKLYEEYQNKNTVDTDVIEKLKENLTGKKILLLGPGKTLESDKNKVAAYISDIKPIVIAVNFLNDAFPTNYVFMGNAKRYSQFFSAIYSNDEKVLTICTSNITEAEQHIDYIVNYQSLLSDVECIRDNPLVMLLNLLKKINVDSVTMAGFDGYVENNEKNYYGAYIPMLYCQDNVLLRNEAIKAEITVLQKNMKITSLTQTRYI